MRQGPSIRSAKTCSITAVKNQRLVTVGCLWAIAALAASRRPGPLRPPQNRRRVFGAGPIFMLSGGALL